MPKPSAWGVIHRAGADRCDEAESRGRMYPGPGPRFDMNKVEEGTSRGLRKGFLRETTERGEGTNRTEPNRTEPNGAVLKCCTRDATVGTGSDDGFR